MQPAARRVKPPKPAEANWVRVAPSPAEFERDSPGAEALATECAINVLHVRDLLWTRLDRLMRPHGIPSTSGFVILNILDGAGTPLAPNEIAQRMFLTPGTVTGLIATLQKHGYVTATKGAGRGRHVQIDITEQGRSIQRAAVRDLDPRVVNWLACFDTTEKLTFLRLLGKLGTHLKSEPTGGGHRKIRVGRAKPGGIA